MFRRPIGPYRRSTEETTPELLKQKFNINVAEHFKDEIGYTPDRQCMTHIINDRSIDVAFASSSQKDIREYDAIFDLTTTGTYVNVIINGIPFQLKDRGTYDNPLWVPLNSSVTLESDGEIKYKFLMASSECFSRRRQALSKL
jgi:hypothetical protein